jgi:hypothetical protein
MRNFHLTRIAVNLLLIVALAIQPVAVCLADVGGGSGCSETGTVTCQGCGCCEVERADDRCCCCSGAAEPEAKEEVEPSCCSGTHHAADESEVSTGQESAPSIAPIDTGVRSTCLCQQESQPLSDSSPRRPTNENRDLVSLDSSDRDESGWNSEHLIAKRLAEAEPAAPSRFAQVMLCIWRL